MAEIHVQNISKIKSICYSVADERDAIQKKTFTKWVNKHLKKVGIFKQKQFTAFTSTILFFVFEKFC